MHSVPFCVFAIILLFANCHCEETAISSSQSGSASSTPSEESSTNATASGEQPKSLLDMLAPEKAADLRATLANETEDSVAGREKAVQDWIDKQPKELKAKLVPFENAEVANEQLSDQEVSIVVSQRKLSPEAANVEQKIASIEVNKALKPEEKEKQLDAVVDSMPDSVKKEIGIADKSTDELHGLMHDLVKQEKEQSF